MDRAAHTHEAEGSRAGRGPGRSFKGRQNVDHTARNTGTKPSRHITQVGMKCEAPGAVLWAISNLSLSEVHIRQEHSDFQ